MREVTLKLNPALEGTIDEGTCFVRVYVVDEDSDPIATFEISANHDVLHRSGDLHVSVQRWRDIDIDVAVGRLGSSDANWLAEVRKRAAEAFTS